MTQNTLLFSQCIAAVCLPKYVVVMLQNFTHFVSAMAAIVNLAPISDLLPILDIDDVSYTRVQEVRRWRKGAATFYSSV